MHRETNPAESSTGSDAWPDATLVVRGGRRDPIHLANVMRRDGSWSVLSGPGLSFEALCTSVRHGTVRRTTLGQVRDAGGTLMPSRAEGAPPHHCDLAGLTAARFEAILGREEQNPIPARERWRGLS